VTLATSGAWQGPMILLAGGNGCSKVSDLVGQAVTVVVPRRDPDAKVQLQAVRSVADPAKLAVLQVDDVHDLNASMVCEDRLRHMIVETLQRGQSYQPPAPECADASDDVRARLRWLFSEWDMNSDGRVSHVDFQHLLMQLDPDADLSHMLQHLDSNGDGMIDIDEFLSWALSDDRTHNLLLSEATTEMPPASTSGPQQHSVAAGMNVGGIGCQLSTDSATIAAATAASTAATPSAAATAIVHGIEVADLESSQQEQQQMQQPPQDGTIPRNDDSMSASAEVPLRLEKIILANSSLGAVAAMGSLARTMPNTQLQTVLSHIPFVVSTTSSMLRAAAANRDALQPSPLTAGFSPLATTTKADWAMASGLQFESPGWLRP